MFFIIAQIIIYVNVYSVVAFGTQGIKIMPKGLFQKYLFGEDSPKTVPLSGLDFYFLVVGFVTR